MQKVSAIVTTQVFILYFNAFSNCCQGIKNAQLVFCLPRVFAESTRSLGYLPYIVTCQRNHKTVNLCLRKRLFFYCSEDVLREDRAIGDPFQGDKSNFLHPVLYYYISFPSSFKGLSYTTSRNTEIMCQGSSSIIFTKTL